MLDILQYKNNLKKKYLMGKKIKKIYLCIFLAISAYNAEGMVSLPTCAVYGAVLTACLRNDVNVVRDFVIENPCLVTAQNFQNNGNTLLHVSASFGYVGMSRFLIDKGASMFLTNNAWDTPIDLACWHGKTHIIALFLENGIHINQINFYGDTMLLVSTYYRRNPLISFLLEKGADQKIPNGEGFLPLHIAIKNFNFKAVQLFFQHSHQLGQEIDLSADVDYIEDETKQSLLHFACAEFNHQSLSDLFSPDRFDTSKIIRRIDNRMNVLKFFIKSRR